MEETLKINENDFKFLSPFTSVIAGQSGSGKSTLVIKLIKHYKELITPQPKSLLYCYGTYNNKIPQIQALGVKLHAGLPSDEVLNSCPKPLLLILDDMMLQLNRQTLADFFTRKSHHSNISLIFIVQNLFEKHLKIVRDNCFYFFLLNSPAAALQVRNLGQQIFPGKLNYFLSAYKQAVTENKWGYLLIDLHPAGNPLLRLRTNLFKESEFQIVFIPE
jgi:hypothetical protein